MSLIRPSADPEGRYADLSGMAIANPALYKSILDELRTVDGASLATIVRNQTSHPILDMVNW